LLLQKSWGGSHFDKAQCKPHRPKRGGYGARPAGGSPIRSVCPRLPLRCTETGRCSHLPVAMAQPVAQSKEFLGSPWQGGLRGICECPKESTSLPTFGSIMSSRSFFRRSRMHEGLRQVRIQTAVWSPDEAPNRAHRRGSECFCQYAASTSFLLTPRLGPIYSTFPFENTSRSVLWEMAHR
jgi:hypothetical protein